MQGFKYRLSPLYTEFEETPELTKFHRYVDLWSWTLNDHIVEVEKKLRECNDIIANISKLNGNPREYILTDYHRAYVIEEHPELKAKIEELKCLLRRYSKDLMLAHGVANLPEQDEVFARYLARYKGLFGDDGIYRPTKEPASIYREVSSQARTCSLKSREDEDFATNFILRHLEAANKRRIRLVDCLLMRPVREKTTLPQYVSLKTVRTIMHMIAGVYVAILFTGSFKILSSLESENMRIVVLGLLCLLVMWSLILLVPTLKRDVLFAVGAAYFAVGGVYIGTRGLDWC